MSNVTYNVKIAKFQLTCSENVQHTKRSGSATTDAITVYAPSTCRDMAIGQRGLAMNVLTTADVHQLRN